MIEEIAQPKTSWENPNASKTSFISKLRDKIIAYYNPQEKPLDPLGKDARRHFLKISLGLAAALTGITGWVVSETSSQTREALLNEPKLPLLEMLSRLSLYVPFSQPAYIGLEIHDPDHTFHNVFEVWRGLPSNEQFADQEHYQEQPYMAVVRDERVDLSHSYYMSMDLPLAIAEINHQAQYDLRAQPTENIHLKLILDPFSLTDFISRVPENEAKYHHFLESVQEFVQLYKDVNQAATSQAGVTNEGVAQEMYSRQELQPPNLELTITFDSNLHASIDWVRTKWQIGGLTLSVPEERQEFNESNDDLYLLFSDPNDSKYFPVPYNYPPLIPEHEEGYLELNARYHQLVRTWRDLRGDLNKAITTLVHTNQPPELS